MVINYWLNTSLDQWTKERQLYKDTRKQEAAQRAEVERQAQWNVLFDCAMNSTDTKTIKQYTSASNLNDLAVSIGKWIKETTGKNLKPWLEDNDIVCSYLNKYPERERDVSNYLAWKTTLEEAQNKLGLYRTVPNEDQYIESDTGVQKAKRIGVGTLSVGAGIVWTDVWVNLASRLWENIFRPIYNSQFKTPEWEQYKIRSVNNDVINAQKEVSAAEDALKEAKASGQWIDEAEKALNEAKEKLKNAKGSAENVETKAKTAYDANIWGSDERIRDVAYNKAQDIYEWEIKPLLKNSDDTLNIPELIKNIDIEEVVKVDPWKKSSLWDALEELLDEYTKWEKFGNLPMLDAQNLKSDLYKELPDSIWKWRTIPANDRKTVRQLLAWKIREWIQESLDKNLSKAGKSAATLYRKASNLERISEDAIKNISRNSWELGEMWKWLSSVWRKTWEPIASGVSLLLSKTSEAIKNNTLGKWIRNFFKRAGESKIGKNFKATFGKWVRATDPIGTIQLLELWGELWDAMLWWDTTLWNITEALGQVPWVQVWDALDEMASAASEWNWMTEEERVNMLINSRREDYGVEVPYEQAIKSYEYWKKQSWSEDGRIHGFNSEMRKVMSTLPA